MNPLLPSIESKLIKCDYRIQVSLYFDNFVTSGYRPRVKLPIIISHFFDEENNNINNNNPKNYLIEYDKNFINANSGNNLINDNGNISNINNSENNILNNDLTEYIKSNKLDKQIKSENYNNNKHNYIEMKKEFYNVNEI